MGMSEVEALLRARIDRHFEVDDWDLPPTLAVLNRTPEGVLEFTPYQFQDFIWEAAPPWQMLRVLAVAFSQPDHPPIPIAYDGEVEGVAFLVEGWGLDARRIPEEEREAAHEWALEHRIADHPAGVETYVASAVTWPDYDGIVTTRFRGSEEVLSIQGDSTSGRIRDGLTLLLASIRGEPDSICACAHPKRAHSGITGMCSVADCECPG